MSRQRFTTTEVLALEVQADYPAGQPVNLIANPNGTLGAWGWLSPTPNTRVRTHDTGHGLRFEISAATLGGAVFWSERVRLSEAIGYAKIRGKRIASSAPLTGSGVGVGVRPVVHFYDDDGGVLGSTTASAGTATHDGNTLVSYGSAPAGATQLALALTLTNLSSSTPLPAGTFVVLEDVAMAADDVPQLTVDPGWVDILGPSLEVSLERAELDLGIVTVEIRDATLDPAAATTIRKGKPIRFQLNGEDDLVTATIRDAKVVYALAEEDPDRRARITLTAVDATTKPAGIPSPDGVATVAELAHLFEGAGTPWNLDGDTGHTAGDLPVTVSTNAAASLLDQVALTRDTVLGYAWVDRHGVVNVWNAATLAASTTKTLTAILDETRYNDVDLDYDTDRCINSVGIQYLRLDPATGESEEITYGPFRDDPSVAEWGLHHEDFTVHGIAEDALDDYAAAILAANATPRRIVTGATLTLTTQADLDDFAALDLYDAVRVVNTRGGVDEVLRVVTIRHKITQNRWVLDLGFATDARVAPPQLLPSPPPTAVESLASLLRPVGEVTAMMGLPSQVWPGWLVLNGAALTPGEYPDLEAWLAAAGLPTNVLPDLTDRLPVGAGVKALGAKTGAWTKTIGETHLPAHRHGQTRSASTGGGSAIPRGGAVDGTTTNSDNTGGGNPLDITPPVFGLYWVIRARSGV